MSLSKGKIFLTGGAFTTKYFVLKSGFLRESSILLRLKIKEKLLSSMASKPINIRWISTGS